MEDIEQLGIHLYLHLPLGLDLGVALLHLEVHPVCKRLANEGIHHVADVGPWKLFSFLLDKGQGPQYVGDGFGLFQHLLNGEALIVGNFDDLDVRALDVAPFAAGHVPEVPDGDMFRLGQVPLHLVGQEASHIPLGGEFGSELGRSDLPLGLNLILWNYLSVGHSLLGSFGIK